MSLREPSQRRQLPVRLCDIRRDYLCTKAASLAAREPANALDIIAAAVMPSDRTYFVHESARPLYDRIRRAA